MSFPDDETRDPQDNLKPEDSEAGEPEDSMGADDEFAEESLADSELPDVDDTPETAEADGADVSAAQADGLDETLEFAAPAESESGIALESMGMDEVTAEAAGAEESEETVEFAAPAEAESGIAFQAVGVVEETVEETEGDEFLAGITEDLGDFGVANAEGATGEEEEGEVEEEEKEPAESRVQKVLSAVAGTDPYTVLMGIAFVALAAGVLFFYLELAAYDFDIWAEKAKQLVGTINLGWLL